MRRNKVFLFLIVMLAVVLVQVACEKTQLHYFKFNNAFLQKVQLDVLGPIYTGSTATEKAVFEPMTFGIEITLTAELIAAANKRNFSIIPSAYAFRYNANEYQLIDPINSFTINTINDFDDQHLAGSEVSEFFKTPYGGDYYPVTKLLDTINFFNTKRYSVDQLIDSKIIMLRQDPILNTDQQFEICVGFVSGNKIIKETDVIQVQ